MPNRLTIESTVSATLTPDWPITVVSVGGQGTVNIDLPANQTANRPLLVHATFVPAGTPLAGLSASLVIGSWPSGFVDVPATPTVDTPLTITVPNVAPGTYQVVIIGEFAE